MKKYLFSLLIASLSLVACQHTDTESKPEGSSDSAAFDRTSLSIVAPTCAPALAFYNYANLKNFETNSNPQTGIIPQMSGEQKDVVVLPTNAGMNVIINQSSKAYKIAATLTFGNFYIVSMGNDPDQTMNEGDTIVLFQKNNVPDKIFHYIYGDTLNSSIHYVSAVDKAAAAVIGKTFVDEDTGTNMTPNYVMVAEPALTNALKKNTDAKVYADLQAKYKEKSGNKEIYQASVFVKASLEREKVTSFLSSLKADVEAAIVEPALLSAGMNKASNAAELFGVAPQMAENVLKQNNGMGLGFKYAKENKAAIENFLTLFGIDGSNEALYF